MQAWFESKHDIDLSLELFGRELGEVDHAFLEDTLGVREPERQANILRVLHHDIDSDELLSSTWDTMHVWAWCSHHDLPLLGQVALKAGLDGKGMLRLTPRAAQRLIERLAETTPDEVQRALLRTTATISSDNSGAVPSLSAALRRQSVQLAESRAGDEVAKWAALRHDAIEDEFAAVREFLGPHPKPEWDADEVAAWLIVHETASGERFAEVEDAVRNAASWKDGIGMDGADILDEADKAAAHLFPDAAGLDRQLLRVALDAGAIGSHSLSYVHISQCALARARA